MLTTDLELILRNQHAIMVALKAIAANAFHYDGPELDRQRQATHERIRQLARGE